MIRLITPKVSAESKLPIIFLAGPVVNAPAWHEKAIDLLTSSNIDAYIACPKRRNEYEKDYSSILADDDRFMKFEDQLIWERHYMKKASKCGAIMFWLTLPNFHNCSRTYARDTRGELGEWRGLMHKSKPRIVIGAEEKFDGLDIIKRNYQAVNPKMKFYDTLEDTVNAAIILAVKH